MIPKERPTSPHWAGRVSKRKIAQIYEDDAQGMHDEDLINDVAYTLLARCKSMVVVEAARNGQAVCPGCKGIIEHQAQKGSQMKCSNCDWSGTWDAYRESMDGLHLIAPGLQPFLQEYIKRLPAARTTKERVFWIDWLIHRVHWEGTALPGQAGAVCLIQGRAADVNRFLDDLTAGIYHSRGAEDLVLLWSDEKKEQIKKWRAASEKRARKGKAFQILIGISK